MATINSREIVDQIIKGNGEYHSEECIASFYRDGGQTGCICDAQFERPVSMIVEYKNFNGGTAYGLVLEGEPNKYYESIYVRSPKIIWQVEDD